MMVWRVSASSLRRMLIRCLVIVCCGVLACGGVSAAEVEAVPLADVTLLDGPFKTAQERAAESLLGNYDVDRMVARARTAAGLDAKAEPYEGWTSNLTGHAMGHYLTGLSMAYVVTGNPEFRRRAEYFIDELATVQAAHGNGFVVGPPGTKQQFEDRIAKGDVTSQGFTLNGLSVPLYAIHKVMAGLRDAHQCLGSERALEVEKGFGLWICNQLGALDEDDFATVRACEHGGIQEVLADLSVTTGDDRYLQLARRFYDPKLMDDLVAGRDNLLGLHANTQLPKYTGLLRVHESTGSPRELQAAAFFWQRVARHHSYATGGNSDHEHFGPADKLNDRLTSMSTETCNTYNMLKLTSALFTQYPSADKADFMERAMVNHSLASQNPQNAHQTYFLSLGMGGARRFDDPLSFTCCVGSGMEHHFYYPTFIYYRSDDRLYVNQFIASQMRWADKHLTVTQRSDFPHGERTELTFTCAEPVMLEVLIRRPHWLGDRGVLSLNGPRLDLAPTADGYYAIRRTWSDGDRLTFAFPFTLRSEPMPDNPMRVALMHGPLLLGADLGPHDDPAAGEADYLPVFLPGDRALDEWVAPDASAANTFRTVEAGEPRDIVLRPFYQLHDRRTSPYFDLFTAEQWAREKRAYRQQIASFRNLEARTVDFVQLGEMQPERDHNFRGENVEVGEYDGRKVRRARGGWFSVDLKVDPGVPLAMIVNYYGNVSGNEKATFDVVLDGDVLVTRNIHWHSQDFFDETFNLDPQQTAGKETVTVGFRAAPQFMAGPVSTIRIIRTN